MVEACPKVRPFCSPAFDALVVPSSSCTFGEEVEAEEENPPSLSEKPPSFLSLLLLVLLLEEAEGSEEEEEGLGLKYRSSSSVGRRGRAQKVALVLGGPQTEKRQRKKEARDLLSLVGGRVRGCEEAASVGASHNAKTTTASARPPRRRRSHRPRPVSRPQPRPRGSAPE